VRSCASSENQGVVGRETSGSDWVSASRMPSVSPLIRLSFDNLIGEAHLPADQGPPRRDFRFPRRCGAATLLAAIRRGCVMPTRPCVPLRPPSAILGNCVVLPEPVSPPDDDHLMREHGGGDVRAPGGHRQASGNSRWGRLGVMVNEDSDMGRRN